jgi:hexosaminidase
MKKLVPFLVFLLVAVVAVARQDHDLAIIPQPVSLEKNDGTFDLSATTRIELKDNNPEIQKVARYLTQYLLRSTGYNLAVQSSGGTSESTLITFAINKTAATQIGNEGYSLEVTPRQVNIQANHASGLFYGIQSLLQLLPKEIESKTVVKKDSWKIPAVKITDYPRFGYRGLMLDVSRHFFTKDEVKDFIDQMVKYKYNILHFHLTDDQGWRLEIKSLPKLTEIGAWNVKKTGRFGTFSPPADNEPRDFGGFYTQDDIRELVAFAADRYVNILPEIDIPGHSLAAIASYPELTCTPGKYKVNSGEKFMEWPAGGHFYGLIDNTLCPANEKVYQFLDKVFTEVAQLFPYEYIHMGGDETAKNFWEKNSQIKALMQREKLKDMNAVQSYFVRRVEKIINSKGKKMIGWDEILEGGLAPNATVMSWRGVKGGIEAAKLGHDVIMSPTTFAYLDYMQGDAIVEPPVYATLKLKTAYQFDPLPEGVDPKYIKGGQGNIWTEQIYNTRHLQYMIWPRTFAIAESVWSPKEKKNWTDFIDRVESHFERFDEAELNYSKSMYDPAFRVTKDSGTGILKVELNTEVEGLDIYYSFDNSFPDRFYPRYSGPLQVPKDASNLKVVTYRGKEKMGRDITMPVEELNRRAGRRR